MKFNFFTGVLSLILAGILSYFLTYYVTEQHKYLFGIGSFLSLAINLLGTISFSFEYNRTTTLTRVTSGVFFLIILACQIIFLFLNSFILPTYLLVVGGLSVIYILIIYGITKSKH